MDAGVDRGYVSGIEQGKANITLEVVDRLAAALEADIAELFVLPASDAVQPTPLRAGRRKS